jgi:predicted DNA-binding transcriptional regulator AlpA
MTPADLRLWIDTRNVSDREAAKQLGCSRNSLRKWLRTGNIPPYIALACSALAWGLPPFRADTEQK